MCSRITRVAMAQLDQICLLYKGKGILDGNVCQECLSAYTKDIVIVRKQLRQLQHCQESQFLEEQQPQRKSINEVYVSKSDARNHCPCH
jgi:ABC-type uncharacterized transport system ATPase subunit